MQLEQHDKLVFVHWAHKAFSNGVTTLTILRNTTNLCIYTVGPRTPSVDTGAVIHSTPIDTTG